VTGCTGSAAPATTPVPGYYAIGIRTFTSSIVAIAPRLALELDRLGAAGDGAALAQVMNEFVVPLYELRARKKGYEVSAMKALMDLAGLSGGPARPPLPEVAGEDREALRAVFEAWRPWL
jgi:5-dehydro-4-deoxyglucarate dehydratase